MVHLNLKNIKGYNNFPREKKIIFKRAFETAEEIIRKIYWKYNLSFLKDVMINPHSKGNFRGQYDILTRTVLISLHTNNTIHFYPRMRCKYATPISGIKTDYETYLTDVLVHELTHAVQHQINSGRGKFNEVETTNSEIYYLKNYKPELFDQLIHHKKNKHKKNDKVRFKTQLNKRNKLATIINTRVCHGGIRMYTIKFENGWVIEDVDEDDLKRT